jgi:hypothetical protein
LSASRAPASPKSKPKKALSDKPVTFHRQIKSSGYGFVQPKVKLGQVCILQSDGCLMEEMCSFAVTNAHHSQQRLQRSESCKARLQTPSSSSCIQVTLQNQS